MMMRLKCPYCGAELISQTDPDYDWSAGEDECIITWNGRCHQCEGSFIVSEVATVASRLVAKDTDDLEELITKEETEKRNKEE